MTTTTDADAHGGQTVGGRFDQVGAGSSTILPTTSGARRDDVPDGFALLVRVTTPRGTRRGLVLSLAAAQRREAAALERGQGVSVELVRLVPVERCRPRPGASAGGRLEVRRDESGALVRNVAEVAH